MVTAGSVTEAPRASGVVRTTFVVAPVVWSAKVKWTETWGSLDGAWLATTTVTPIREVGLITDTAGGVPCGVGRAGGGMRTGRRRTAWVAAKVGDVATRSTWAATLPSCQTWGWVTQTDRG